MAHPPQVPGPPASVAEFKPYISDETPNLREFTWIVLVVGILQAALFGLADS